jgi:hypothetical protein
MRNKVSRTAIRWIASRKAKLVERIDAGEISEEEARTRYHLSPEELAEWRRHYSTGGVLGLMEKHIPLRRYRSGCIASLL